LSLLNIMNPFKKGDVLLGQKRNFEEAYHPIVFINGPVFAPSAVILTHSAKFPCNIKLSGKYGLESSYFVAHLIEKLAEWGPYKKIGQLSTSDLILIEKHISNQSPITWAEYEKYNKNGCPQHPLK